jgi:DNA sulfur modification protein DndC
MEAMIDSGEEWLTPLLEYRDMLSETQIPERKHEFRDFRRRTGQVSFIGKTDRVMPGPYTIDFCRKLLTKLLHIQNEVRRDAPIGEAPVLIQEAELHEIRRLWRTERGDWPDTVPRLVREILGRELDWVAEDAIAFTADDGELLDAVCVENDVPTELVMKLLDIERASHGLKRRHAVHTRIEEAFKLEWRDLDVLIEARRREIGGGPDSELLISGNDPEIPFDGE